MDDTTIIKIVAMTSLTVLEVVNLITAQIDGTIFLTLGAIIGGIAGYEIKTVEGKRRKKNKSKVY